MKAGFLLVPQGNCALSLVPGIYHALCVCYVVKRRYYQHSPDDPDK